MTDMATQTPSTDLAISSEQSTFTEKQLAGLRQLGIDDASEGDIDLFFHRCRVTGLDPFSKQIYMIGRRTKVKVWDEAQRKQVDQWVMKYTIQTGIDGYRLNGARAIRKRGDEVAIGSPMWRGVDSGWDDVWLDANHPPAAARFTITVNGNEFTATAMYAEYVQTISFTENGKTVTKPNSMWQKMPANQLAKCAEAACWRKAYPDDFSGLILEDAAQVIDEEGNRVTVESERGGNGAKGARAAMGLEQRPEPVDITATHTETEKQPAAKPAPKKSSQSRAKAEPSQASAPNQGGEVDGDAPATTGQLKALSTLFAKQGFNDWPSQLQWFQGNAIVDGDLAGPNELTGAQAAVAIDVLQ